MPERLCLICQRPLPQVKGLSNGRPRTTHVGPCKAEYNRRMALRWSRRKRGKPAPVFEDEVRLRAMQNIGGRSLDVAEILELQRRVRLEEWTIAQVAFAYGVSPRTVQRYLTIRDVQVIEVSGFACEVGLVGKGAGTRPMQLSPWRRL